MKTQSDARLVLEVILKRGVYPLGLVAGLVFCGWVIWYSYIMDFSFFFYNGLVGLFALLCLAKHNWPKSAALHVTANTLILFTVFVPLADAILSAQAHWAKKRLLPPVLSERIYFYEVAKGNPAQFAVWWDRMIKECARLCKQITVQDPKNRLPYILKPGSTGNFFDSRIRINRLGFRDREFALDKKDRYRIVAIGESTTMGFTIKEDGRPWPKVLEALVRKELSGARPVEVLNAGVAGYSLQEGLIRLRRDVLPLKPDMIISYFGYNGFPLLDDTFGEAGRAFLQTQPPRFVHRPSVLLGRAEHGIRLFHFKRKYFSSTLLWATFASRKKAVFDSVYTQLHRELISIARTNHIRLVLLSHNLAVNRESPKEVIEFYRGGFPDVGYRMQANRLQTYILEELARRNKDVLYVNTAEGLDGHHENFIDLVHLTQKGRNKLAENVCNGIKEHLQHEIAGQRFQEPASRKTAARSTPKEDSL
ncbi:MAG: hypothetical protein HY674_06850 [Chloroflexi bacterium]|nr:hypothetical protein [Chloroflexota bacterium]